MTSSAVRLSHVRVTPSGGNMVDEPCWRLDDETLPVLAANPVWVDFVNGLNGSGVPRSSGPDAWPSPLAAAYDLLDRRMGYVGITWSTERQASNALMDNMGGGIPIRVIKVILEAASHARTTSAP